MAAVTAAPPDTAAPAGRRHGPRPPARRVLAGVAVAALTLLPLGFVAYEAVQTGWAEASRLIFRQRTADLLWNTVRLTASCVALSLVLGVGAAWLVERSDLPGRSFFSRIILLPLLLPSLGMVLGWFVVWGPGGSLTHLFQDRLLSLDRTPTHTLA